MQTTFDADAYRDHGWRTALDENYYVRLGLEPNGLIEPSDIAAAFQARHGWWLNRENQLKRGQAVPILNTVGPHVPQAIKNLSLAKNVLSDPSTRAAYDRELFGSRLKAWREGALRGAVGTLTGTVSRDVVSILVAQGVTLGFKEADARQVVRAEFDRAGLKVVDGASEAAPTPVGPRQQTPASPAPQQPRPGSSQFAGTPSRGLTAGPAHTIEGRITRFPVSDRKHEISIGGVVVGADGAVWAGLEARNKDNSRVDWVGRLQDGKWTWVTDRLPGFITFMTLGVDGAIWFTGTNGYAGSMGRLEPNGKITEISLGSPTPDDFDDKGARLFEPRQRFGWGEIISCSDGRLWVSGKRAAVMMSVGPDGVRRYPMPSGINPQHLTEGPDNALWFTSNWNERSGSKSVGRMDFDGALRQYALPGYAAGPVTMGDALAADIVAGSDGYLWLAESERARLSVMSTAGEIMNRIDLQPVNAYGQGPGAITAGPDGALWVTGGLFAPNYVVRVDIHGSQTYLSLGDSSGAHIFTDGVRLWLLMKEPDKGDGRWPPVVVCRID